jgi:hypothetical protein
VYHGRKGFAWSFPSGSTFLQADFGIGYWGGILALGYDEDGDGKIRHDNLDEIGPSILIGCNTTQMGVRVGFGSGAWTQVNSSPLSALCSDPEQWIRLRLEIDVDANGGQGSGSLFYQNLSTGDPGFQPVVGLQDINLGMNPAATNARNPALWNTVFVKFESGGNSLDDIVIGR